MRFYFFIFTVFILLAVPVEAQVADTVKLDEIEIRASRIYVAERYQPISISRIDSSQIQIYSSSNISNLLESFAPVHVRTNGPGGLATISQRGFSPSQTQVLWNGFQLNHAMLGLTDLSTIPAFAVEQIKVASGNGNTSFGDKGGGTVAIKTRRPQNEIGFSQSIGSFGQSISEAYAGGGFGNWTVGLTTGVENSSNNFTYSKREFSNEAGGFINVEKKRENNKLKAETGILSVDWQKKLQHFSTIVWAHDMHNEIPGSINGLSPMAYQNDAYLRWMSRYSTNIKNQRIAGKIYLNRQDLDFINPASNINSISTNSSLLGDIELRSTLHPNLQLISAVQIGWSKVEASDYSGSPERSQFTVQLNPVWHLLNPVHTYGGFRFDYYSDFEDAYSANMGLNIELFKDVLFLKGQVSRNFIAPTFNDLYWPALGNPDIKPETNFKYETGLLVEITRDIIQNSMELTYYDGRVEDGIRWLPGNDGRSRPQNLEELRLWGFEVRENLTVKLVDFRFNLQAMLMHSLAELTEPRFEGDQAINKQLRYTPKWQAKGSAMLSWKNFSTLFSYNFTDERFSSADHSSPFDPLPAYRHATLNASYQVEWNGFRFIPQLSVQNLLDEEYSVIRDYPMPGKSYQFKLTIKYKLK